MIWILCIGYLFGAVTAQPEVIVDFGLDVTNAYIGKLVNAIFTITVPDSQATSGTVIETLVDTIGIFAIDVNSINCTFNGAVLTFGNPNFCTDFEKHYTDGYSSAHSVFYISHVVMNTGTITSSGGSQADNTFTVSFDVVYISSQGQAIDSTHPVSAGFLYDDGRYIWIAQCDLTLKGADYDPNETPTFILDWDPSSATTISDNGEQLTAKLTVGIPYIEPNLKLEVVSLNDTNCGIVIEKVQMISAGAAYLYQLQPDLIKADALDQCCPTSLTIDIGRLVNIVSQNDGANPDDNAIEFEMQFMSGNSTIEAGENLVIGVAVYVDSTEIWVASLEIEKAPASTPGPIACSVRVGDGITTPLKPYGVYMDVNLPPGSTSFTISITTDVEIATANKLSILAANVMFTGDNIPCNPSEGDMNLTLTESVEGSGVKDGATLEFSVFNHNLQENPQADSDNITLLIYYTIILGGSKDETYKSTISGCGPQQNIFFTAGDEEQPQSSVDNTFDIQHKCGDKPFETGSVIDYYLVVSTERDSWAGETTIEGPIPADLTNSDLIFVSATGQDIGKNVLSVPHGLLDTNFSSWPESDIADRGVTKFSVYNSGDVNDVMEDDYSIKVSVKVKDNATLMTGSPTTKMALGIKYSAEQIVILECEISFQIPKDLGEVKYITGITVDADDECADDAKLQWSPDNLQFYDFTYSWEDYIVIPGQPTTMLLDTPLFAQYVRLVNTNGGCSCSYTPIAESVTWEFRGENTKKLVLARNMMQAFDKDNTTCMPLPTKDSTDTPTYFLLNLPAGLPYMNVDGENAFKVHVTGQGIECNSPGGPSVVKVSNPHVNQQGGPLKFKGLRKKCDYLDKTTHTDSLTDLVTCHYHCKCTDADTCKDINLLVVHHNTPSGNYSLCDITTEQ